MMYFTVPVLVEGRYDKAHLSSMIGSMILTTDGFGVFRNEEKRALIRKLGERGLILLTDSDGGGRQIRSKLKGQLGGIRVYDLYVPAIPGKERRKAVSSKAGVLGVEGIPAEILRDVLDRFAEAHPELTDASGCAPEKEPILRSQMFELGLTGAANASENRAALCRKLGMPEDMTANALYAALNVITDRAGLDALMKQV